MKQNAPHKDSADTKWLLEKKNGKSHVEVDQVLLVRLAPIAIERHWISNVLCTGRIITSLEIQYALMEIYVITKMETMVSMFAGLDLGLVVIAILKHQTRKGKAAPELMISQM